MSIFLTIARPYAEGAFRFALENNSVESWLYMLQFTAEVSKDDHVIRLLSSFLTPYKIAEIFIYICKDRLDIFFCNFIRIMSYNKRLHLLPIVFEHFLYLRNLECNIITVELFSANEMSSDCISNIVNVVKKKLKCVNINLVCKLDRSIIAGFVVRVNGSVIDCSLRGRLESFKDFLFLN